MDVCKSKKGQNRCSISAGLKTNTKRHFRDELNIERIYKWMLDECSSYNTYREIRIRNIVECYLQYRAHVHSSCGKHLNYFQFYAGFVYAHNIELCPVWIGPDWPLCRPYRSSIVYTGVISSLQKKIPDCKIVTAHSISTTFFAGVSLLYITFIGIIRDTRHSIFRSLFAN